jgi:hypothetical protein
MLTRSYRCCLRGVEDDGRQVVAYNAVFTHANNRRTNIATDQQYI